VAEIFRNPPVDGFKTLLITFDLIVVVCCAQVPNLSTFRSTLKTFLFYQPFSGIVV
jgi:hypothetical protein